MSEIERRIEDLKKELELQRKMIQKILDFWNEHRDTPSNHGSVELEKKTGHPQVGFTRVSDNSIHLGQGVYVPKNSYLTAASRSKTPSQFVRKMIMAVFSPKELQDSSVHGAKSNKVKQKSQKEGLDPVRLQAVKDIFSYYLKESAQFDKEKHDAQMKQFYNYVSSKITDTRAEKKRPNEKNLPKVKPVESSDTEDISDIEEDTIASNGEEDSGESTDEVSAQEECDNAMIQE
ncbi:uncharacterized protein LOC141538023 isoform X4 [Cotesia typhae]|uniref:uncharacterized protein LOC141538023 isoform X4 n=1 Tax=Cotesia typhae TaxID=2053667 RepID=UPI003D697F98